MSTLQNNQASWTNLSGHQHDSKYEKCRNITEEIYKRINITFQIKKLETGEQSEISDNSDQIDSNELSNETDLFACDKSDISSSTEAERPPAPPVLLNNNNEEKTKAVVYKRPRKRFRKRVKKRPPIRQRSDSEGSSDEAPLARSLLILPPDMKLKSQAEKKPPMKSAPPNNLILRELLKPTDMKVPTVLIEKIKSMDNEAANSDNSPENIDKAKRDVVTDKKEPVTTDKREENYVDAGIDKGKVMKASKDVKVTDWKNCSMCSLSFRGERGLRRHISMSHIESPDSNK